MVLDLINADIFYSLSRDQSCNYCLFFEVAYSFISHSKCSSSPTPNLAQFSYSINGESAHVKRMRVIQHQAFLAKSIATASLNLGCEIRREAGLLSGACRGRNHYQNLEHGEATKTTFTARRRTKLSA